MQPALSVILASPDHWSSLARTLESLRKQRLREQLEVVLVMPHGAPPIPAQEVEDFWGYQEVAVEAGISIGRANAAGIRAARSAIVCLGEDHCYPEPGWAEALLAAHQQPWAAVGPVVCNANPINSVSWADFWIGYGPWAHPQAAGPREFLPGHNSSYKKEILLGLNLPLESLLEAETVLHWELRRRGHQLWLEPGARVRHVNFWRWSRWIPVQLWAGRVFAAARASEQNWPVWKRCLYSLLSPLIPLVRLSRLPAAAYPYLPTLWVGLCLDALGQMLGYGLGAGSAQRHLCRYEYRREDA